MNTQQINVTEENFDVYFQDMFITYFSDIICVDLVSGGSEKKVIYSNRKEYARLVEQTRLGESKLQAEAIRRGLNMIVP